MGLQNIFQVNSKGFTIVEVITVVTLLGIVLAFGLNINIDFYSGSLFRSERDKIVSVLERARSRALANLYNEPHGVCYIKPNLIIFQGLVCEEGNTNNVLVPLDERVLITGINENTPIIFNNFTGNLNPILSPETNEFMVKIELEKRTGFISVNNLGRINW